MDFDLADLTKTVVELAAEQGRYISEQWSSIGELHYKDRRDMATRVDVDVERWLIDQLSSRFPSHGFHGEETSRKNPEADYQWLIDPIDGTKYYVGLSSLFSVSIALLYREEPILGVVYNVTSRQCFHAFAGGGAFLDQQRLTGPSASELSEVIANVDTPGMDRLSPDERIWFEQRFTQLSRRLYRLRALGVGALSACWVASGALDAYVDLTGYVKPQDLAAGRILMKEAGLRTEYVDVGVGPARLLAAPSAVFEKIHEILV